MGAGSCSLSELEKSSLRKLYLLHCCKTQLLCLQAAQGGALAGTVVAAVIQSHRSIPLSLGLERKVCTAAGDAERFGAFLLMSRSGKAGR